MKYAFSSVDDLLSIGHNWIGSLLVHEDDILTRRMIATQMMFRKSWSVRYRRFESRCISNEYRYEKKCLLSDLRFTETYGDSKEEREGIPRVVGDVRTTGLSNHGRYTPMVPTGCSTGDW